MSTRAFNKAPQLLVRRLNDSAQTGVMMFGNLRMRCALGRGGIRARKREGDGATPRGRWKLLAVYYQPKTYRRPTTALPVRVLRQDDGWCDASCDRNYNRAVRFPYPASTERLWRDDQVYDVVVVLDYNIRPRIRGLGSAIFLHVARPGYTPTEGCIALRRSDLIQVLERVRRGTQIITSA